MRRAINRFALFGFFTIIVILLTQSICTANVFGIVDEDKPRTIRVGYQLAFIYSIENYKNQQFTITASFNETVPQTFHLYVFITTTVEWDLMLNGNLTMNTMTEHLFNGTVEWAVPLKYKVIIPDWEPWTFVFLNLNSALMLTRIRIEHQHILWWLWIVIPLLVVIGLTTYGLLENYTKYERAKMDNNKALKRIRSSRENERKRAAYWLISNGTIDILSLLNDLLDNEKSYVRENVAFVIAGISRRTKNKTMLKSLLIKYEKEKNPIVKTAIVDALCTIPDLSALKIYEKYILLDQNEALRFRIANALEEIGSLKVVPILAKIVNSVNTDSLKIVCNKALEKIAVKEQISVDKLINNYS